MSYIFVVSQTNVQQLENNKLKMTALLIAMSYIFVVSQTNVQQLEKATQQVHLFSFLHASGRNP
jgi:hypothetical protein